MMHYPMESKTNQSSQSWFFQSFLPNSWYFCKHIVVFRKMSDSRSQGLKELHPFSDFTWVRSPVSASWATFGHQNWPCRMKQNISYSARWGCSWDPRKAVGRCSRTVAVEVFHTGKECATTQLNVDGTECQAYTWPSFAVNTQERLAR